jgi:hypothetical protein
MTELEFSKDLEGLRELWACDIYIHEVVSKPPASIFFDEITRREQEEYDRSKSLLPGLHRHNDWPRRFSSCVR